MNKRNTNGDAKILQDPVGEVPGFPCWARDIVFIPDSAAKATFSRGVEVAIKLLQDSWFSTVA